MYIKTTTVQNSFIRGITIWQSTSDLLQVARTTQVPSHHHKNSNMNFSPYGQTVWRLITSVVNQKAVKITLKQSGFYGTIKEILRTNNMQLDFKITLEVYKWDIDILSSSVTDNNRSVPFLWLKIRFINCKKRHFVVARQSLFEIKDWRRFRMRSLCTNLIGWVTNVSYEPELFFKSSSEDCSGLLT